MADYIIEITIPEAKIVDFKEKMLAWWPNSDINPADPEDNAAARDWIELNIKRLLRSKYKRGAERLAEEDETVIT